MMLDSRRQLWCDSFIKNRLDFSLLYLVFHAESEDLLILDVVEVFRIILENGCVTGNDLKLVLHLSISGLYLFLTYVTQILE